MITFKYTKGSQRLTFNSFSLFQIFFIVYFESFCYAMYSIVPEICIGGHFLEDCFYCYSQQIKPAAANESLINYNLIKRTPYFFWVENWYLLTWNLAHMLSNLKTFKEAIKTSWMWHDILYWSHHISASSASNLPFTCFC